MNALGRCVFAFLLFAWATSSWAATNLISQFTTRVWQTDDGLPHNAVQAICQSRDGYLWIGTRDGLARFDGAHFLVFDAKAHPGLAGNVVSSLCETRDGSLWIGTEEGGLTRFQNGKFFHYGRSDGVATANVRTLFESDDGTLWIGTLEGIFLFRDGKFSSLRQKDGLASNIIRYIRDNQQGTIWIATDRGLNFFKNGALDLYNSPESSYGYVRAVCEDRDGTLWFGTMSGATFRKGETSRHFSKDDGLPDNVINAICADRHGNVWIGTAGGLCRFVENALRAENNNSGEAFDMVNAIFEDREGNLWVGAKDGLYRLNPKPFLTYTKQQGLSHNSVMSVLEDKAGDVWIATWGGGLNRLNADGISFTNFNRTFSSDFALSLHEGHDGSLWVGMEFNDGLYQFKEGKWNHYASAEGLTDPAISAIYEDTHTNLWLGTRTALVSFRDGKFTRYTVGDGLAGVPVRAIFEDHEGTLWFGTANGLTCRKGEIFSSFTASNGLSDANILALYEDDAHTLWIGTRGGGLNWLRDGEFKSCSTPNGLFDDTIFSILEDSEGWLWMSSIKGIFRVQKSALEKFAGDKTGEITSIFYGKADGLVSPMCNGVAKPAGWKGKDGRLWFATTKGVAVVDPKVAKMLNETPPTILIEQVLADKKEVARETPPVTRHPSLVTIPPGRGEIEFQYTALSFRAPEKIHFKYKLEGVDLDWFDAGNRRVAHYNNILPGTYHFRVTACNENGIWNDQGATISFTLSPQIWQAWWFLSAVIIAMVGSVAGVARYVTGKNMQRTLERLEHQSALERERARIAKDMHDDLGSSLTRITLLGELVEADQANPAEVETHARKIVSSARETVKSLDEIVWAVDPENDTLNGLIEYLTHYTDEFFENTDVRCRLEIPMDLPDAQLSSEVRHNIFLVIKETLNNALKHAAASEVRLQISATQNILKIEITDNGRGFDLNQTPDGRVGHGLSNMRDRITAVGGQLQFDSAPGQGTRLRFEVKLIFAK